LKWVAARIVESSVAIVLPLGTVLADEGGIEPD
jgi:hypothetical protein